MRQSTYERLRCVRRRGAGSPGASILATWDGAPQLASSGSGEPELQMGIESAGASPDRLDSWVDAGYPRGAPELPDQGERGLDGEGPLADRRDPHRSLGRRGAGRDRHRAADRDHYRGAVDAPA